MKKPSPASPLSDLYNLYELLEHSQLNTGQRRQFMLCLLFCLFADATDDTRPFRRIVNAASPETLGPALNDVFAAVAGGPSPFVLPFRARDLFVPRLPDPSFGSPEVAAEFHALVVACFDQDWNGVSLDALGTLFQGMMDKKVRANNGAHYTNKKDIRKLVKDLFLLELKNELARARRANDLQALKDLHRRIATTKFFDPACGSGNFLLFIHRELRRIEGKILKKLRTLEPEVPLKARVRADQFYGIEIDRMGAAIARLAMHLSELRENRRLETTLAPTGGLSRLTLAPASRARVAFGDSLDYNWHEVCPPQGEVFIVGNPPFVGGSKMTKSQREKLARCAPGIDPSRLDFVCAWILKSAEYIRGTTIRCGLVSTKAVIQGLHPSALWTHLFLHGVKIHFAHRPFTWDSEANGKAAVMVVIIGFGMEDRPQKLLYDYVIDPNTMRYKATVRKVADIGPYLNTGAADVIRFTVGEHDTPLFGGPRFIGGNVPPAKDKKEEGDEKDKKREVDGALIFDETRKEALLRAEPAARPFLRRYFMAEEFVNDGHRYCLWLQDCTDEEWERLPELRRHCAKHPKLQDEKGMIHFKQVTVPPDRENFAVPTVSGHKRHYIPMGCLPKGAVAGSGLKIAADPVSLFHQALYSSRMFMAWADRVSMRMSESYQLGSYVLHSFPLPMNPPEQKVAEIERRMQDLLRRRQELQEGGMTLAKIYNIGSMPKDFLEQHQQIDQLLESLYRDGPFTDDQDRAEFLLRRYREKLESELPPRWWE